MKLSKPVEPVVPIFDIGALPAGWKLVPIGEICLSVQKVNPKDEPNRKFNYIDISGIDNERYQIAETKHYLGLDAPSRARQLVKAGDTVFSTVRTYLKNIGFVTQEHDSDVASTGFCILRPAKPELRKYIYYFVQYEPFLKEISKFQRGTSYPAVRDGDVFAQFIPIPPNGQAYRIVAEIEKQFSRLDEAVANLKRVKANLKRYKAAVLKAAVEGKLTEDWRKANLPAPTSRPGKFYTYAILCEDDSIYIGHTDDIERRWNQHLEGKAAEWTKEHKPVKIAHYEELDTRQEAADREKWLKTGYGRKWIKREFAAGRTRQAGRLEPASKLIERILAERRKKWKGKGKYKEPEGPNTSDLQVLPNSWTWASPEQLSSAEAYSLAIGPFGSNLKVSDYKDSGVPLVFVRNIRAASFGGEGTVFVSEKKAAELKPHQISGGDVLITKMGDPPGDACLYPDDSPPAIITADCIKLRLSPLVPNKNYIVHAINSKVVNPQILRITKGVAQMKVSLARFKNIAIPLPPLSEQFRIIAEVERQLTVIGDFETTAEINLKRGERLRQAILQGAFQGNLIFNEV